jgi:hypothetical protein
MGMGKVIYGTLSKEGRRTVTPTIASALIECNTDPARVVGGGRGGAEEEGDEGKKMMRLSTLIDDVRARWRRLEGNDDDDDDRSSLADEVIRHCLGTAPSLASSLVGGRGGCHADIMPTFVRLLPDGVARMCAHEAFLGGTPRSSSSSSLFSSSSWWREDKLVEAWSTRLPFMPSGYVPRTCLLRGIAVCEATMTEIAGEVGEDRDEG